MQPIKNETVAVTSTECVVEAVPPDCCLLLHPMPPAPKRLGVVNARALGNTLPPGVARRDSHHRNGRYLVKQFKRSWKRKARS
jgi:hypothetical protein